MRSRLCPCLSIQPPARHPGGADAAARSRDHSRTRRAAARSRGRGARGRTGSSGSAGSRRCWSRRPDAAAPNAMRRSASTRRRRRRSAVIGSVRPHALCRFRRVPSDRSSGMRFWRRNVPNEPTPDADTLPPRPSRGGSSGTRAGLPLPAAEAERPRGWFGWRRGDVAEPADPGAGRSRTFSPEPAASDRRTGACGTGRNRPRRFRANRQPEPVVAPEPAPPPSFLASPPRPPSPKQPSRAAGSPGCAPGCRAARTRLNEGINTIFARRRLDAAALEELEELLIASDMGPASPARSSSGCAAPASTRRSRPTRCARRLPRRSSS